MSERHWNIIGNFKQNTNTDCNGNEIIVWTLEGGVFELPFEVAPIEGKHDHKTCEGCMHNLEVWTKHFIQKYNQPNKAFPNCCDRHSNLNKIRSFKRSDFDKVPELAALKIVYFNQALANFMDHPEWERLITNYIEHLIQSFGMMPNNCGTPLFLPEFMFAAQNCISDNSELNPTQKYKLLNFFQEYGKTESNTETNRDLNILFNAYKEWFSLFPFELNPYFQELKPTYQNLMPIVDGRMELNVFSGLSRGKLHSKKSLFELLINLTNSLLTKVNGNALNEKGLLNDTSKIHFDLIVEQRKIEVKQGYKNDSPNERTRYVKMIKEWLKHEKRFISEIASLIKNEERKQPVQDSNKANSFCKSMPIEIPLEHFKRLVTNNSANRKPFLSQEELELFIDKAFRGKTGIQKLKMNMAPRGEKLMIQALFYDFYSHYCMDYFGTSHCQDKFIILLSDNFTGWKFESLSRNFNPKTKKRLRN